LIKQIPRLLQAISNDKKISRATVQFGGTANKRGRALGLTAHPEMEASVPVQVDLSGQTAVVTGASSGIGRAIAERIGASGAHVLLSGRTESPMRESAAKIVAAGGRATVDVGDVRDPDTVRSLVIRAMEADGRLDIFVNNAGYSVFASVLDGDVESWRAMWETNVLALLVGCQAAVKAMRTTGNPTPASTARPSTPSTSSPTRFARNWTTIRFRSRR
jgi:NAD(P)-dependent dehydrogenase (short-subunit alcohol dehydrogenase family)